MGEGDHRKARSVIRYWSNIGVFIYHWSRALHYRQAHASNLSMIEGHLTDPGSLQTRANRIWLAIAMGGALSLAWFLVAMVTVFESLGAWLAGPSGINV